MLKNSIVFTCILALAYITLSSDIDGAAHHGHGNITGSSTGAVGHCQTSSCHGGNNALTLVTLQVLDSSTLQPITTYNALQTYLVTLSGNDTAVTSNLPGWGFMASAVLGNHTQAGTFSIPSALASKIHTFNCGTTTVVEHSVTLSQTTTGVNKYSTQFYWTAPAVGSDSVQFFSLLNAVNGDGGSSGDYPNAAAKVTIYESATSGINSLNNTVSSLALSVYPNPSLSGTTISYPLYSPETVTIQLMDMSGKLISCLANNEYQGVGLHSYTPTLPASGVYIIRVKAGQSLSVARLVKL